MPSLLALCLLFALPNASHSDGADVLAPRVMSVLPRGLTSHAAAALDGWLYVYGGYFGTPHEYCREDQSRAFQRLNLRDGVTWEHVSDEEPVQSAALVAHDGALYRFGGMSAENERHDEPRLRSLDECARFDPRSREWRALPPLPAPRSSHAACVVGSTAVVAGGWNVGGKLGRSSEWCGEVLTLALDVAEATWVAHEAPFRRRAVAAASVEGRVFVLGGMDESGQPSERVDVFELATKSWSRGPDLPETGFGCAAVASGGRVYASARSGRVWRLDGERWVAQRDLASPRYFHQLVASDTGSLLAIGGISGSKRPRLVERIELDGPAAPRVETLTLPSPGAAKNRQAAFLHSGALHFFGGNQRTGQHAFEDAAFVDEGWKFDLATLEWTALPALPVRRQSLQVALARESAWLVGGFARGESGTRAFGDVFVFEPRQESWRVLHDVLRPGRTQFALVEHDSALWIFGGLDYLQGREGGADFRHPLEVLRRPLDAPSDATFEVSDVKLPRERRAFGHAQLDGKLYFVGGLTDGFASVDECDVFDLTSRQWSTIPPPSCTRISPELVALDGRLYLAAGAARASADGDPGPLTSIERFDPATGSWSTLSERLPFDPTHVRMFEHRGRLLVVSTHDERERTLRLAWITP
jgi:N-acetylneuraminic acid mutarotase